MLWMGSRVLEATVKWSAVWMCIGNYSPLSCSQLGKQEPFHSTPHLGISMVSDWFLIPCSRLHASVSSSDSTCIQSYDTSFSPSLFQGLLEVASLLGWALLCPLLHVFPRSGESLLLGLGVLNQVPTSPDKGAIVLHRVERELGTTTGPKGQISSKVLIPNLLPIKSFPTLPFFLQYMVCFFPYPPTLIRLTMKNRCIMVPWRPHHGIIADCWSISSARKKHFKKTSNILMVNGKKQILVYPSNFIKGWLLPSFGGWPNFSLNQWWSPSPLGEISFPN